MTEASALSPEDWAFWDRWMQAQRRLAAEVDRALQRDFGISKAEFSILVTLHHTADGRLRVTELADRLDWDKSRVAHQLTRMEGRGLLERSESGAGRRTGVALTTSGREVVERAVEGHAANVRRLGLDLLTPDQKAAIDGWSQALIDHLALPSSRDSPPADS
ncbi:MarR family winged helix-turn-helix transcriptional regulator [Gordonia hankookensis]|uniref:MarR family transcriptional regulator n=1 Tax=Gordonia hankookensis TaxID=589403 RepID=A0ABR7W6W7_9ACTN|nr:MarR family transcriptional regulator [Gordonia hankookensis]MBD1318498.1 MarR family transcriptional regulator [Gordonia hankookensis]